MKKFMPLSSEKIIQKFSESLNELVVVNNYTYKYIEEHTNLNATTIGRYVNGKSLPKLRNILKLCDFFNCSLDYFFQLNDRKNYTKCSNGVSFFVRLKEIIKNLNLTRYNVAHNCSFSESNFSRWENGAEPNLEHLYNLAVYLNYSMDYLVGLTNII
jgi:hypothetical protein